MKTIKTVYLAGKITGDPKYRRKFRAAALELEAAGFAVVNPATLPPVGFEHEAYMRMGFAMLDECSAVCFLSDWMNSPGACWEMDRARAAKKEVFFYDEWRGTLKEAAKVAEGGAGQNGLQYAT